jgi:hypothetical protein
VLLPVLAERRLAAAQSADLATLLPDFVAPPLTSIGALGVDAFLPKRARRELAAALDTLLARAHLRQLAQGHDARPPAPRPSAPASRS